MSLQLLFEQAVRHRAEHNCSALPYEEYAKLEEAVKRYKPNKVLEIGTGMGFTAAVMAQSSAETNPQTKIDTIEKDPDHVVAAQQFWKEHNVENRINPILGQAEIELANLESNYDLIFFDGYQIHYEFLPHYERLLKPQGILFLANNQLKSKTSDQFFEELEHSGKWRILEKFADTTVAQKI